MRETITLNQEEQKRLYVLNQVIEGKLIARKAAELLKRIVRQVRRWIAEYRRRGAAAVVHGNRGRPPVNRTIDGAEGAIEEFSRIVSQIR
jgi:transposase